MYIFIYFSRVFVKLYLYSFLIDLRFFRRLYGKEINENFMEKPVKQEYKIILLTPSFHESIDIDESNCPTSY